MAEDKSDRKRVVLVHDLAFKFLSEMVAEGLDIPEAVAVAALLSSLLMRQIEVEDKYDILLDQIRRYEEI